MKCMYCGRTESRVVDSRQNDEGTIIRRRRECEVCGKRFTTHETIEYTPIMVVKKDGSRQTFDVQKIKKGIMKAVEKRAVPMARVDRVVQDIHRQIFSLLENEITSERIGELVMEQLKDIDEVAYVRYASVHRQFKDIDTLKKEIEALVKLKDKISAENKEDN